MIIFASLTHVQPAAPNILVLLHLQPMGIIVQSHFIQTFNPFLLLLQVSTLFLPLLLMTLLVML
jgi:hypothetical protein